MSQRYSEGEVVVVPMDGYHLSNRILRLLGRADRKGAPDTFDVASFVSVLQRVRDAVGRDDVYYPVFHRDPLRPHDPSMP